MAQLKTGSAYYDRLHKTMRQSNPFGRIAKKPYKSAAFKKRRSSSFFGLPKGVATERRNDMTTRLRGPKSRRFPLGRGRQ